jgi:hypothetical protein
MCPEDDRQFGRAGHTPLLTLRTVLELPALFTVTAVIGPLSPGVRGRLPKVEFAQAVCGLGPLPRPPRSRPGPAASRVADKVDRFFGSQRRVVHDREERDESGAAGLPGLHSLQKGSRLVGADHPQAEPSLKVRLGPLLIVPTSQNVSLPAWAWCRDGANTCRSPAAEQGRKERAQSHPLRRFRRRIGARGVGKVRVTRYTRLTPPSSAAVSDGAAGTRVSAVDSDAE